LRFPGAGAGSKAAAELDMTRLQDIIDVAPAMLRMQFQVSDMITLEELGSFRIPFRRRNRPQVTIFASDLW